MTHSIYILSAYGCVLIFLVAQWFIPWRRLKAHLRELRQSS